MTWGAMPAQLVESGLYRFGRTLGYLLVNVYAMKMAGVFMISTCTISRKLGLFPRPTALLGYALALLLLLGSGKLSWAPMAFPLWTLLVSVQILLANFRPAPVRADRTPVSPL